MIKIFYLALILFITTINAQIINVSGNISTPGSVVKNALITFIDDSDTSKSYTSLTDSNGNYNIGLVTSIGEYETEIPEDFQLGQNYPNPFANETVINYNLNKQADVSVTIYDILGREVKKFSIGEQNAGIHGIIWDGKNNFGQMVTTGIYFYRLQSGEKSQVNKMIFTHGTETNNILNIKGNFISLNSLKAGKIEKEDAIEVVKTYTCRIEDNNITTPKILTKEINGIKIDRDTTINFGVIDEINAFFPLNIGNEWNFDVTWFDLLTGRDSTIATLDYKIVTTKNVNGKTYFGFNRALPFFPVNSFLENLDSVFVRQNEKGDIYLNYEGNEYLYFTFDTSILGSLKRTKLKDTDYYYLNESYSDTIVTQVGSFNKCFKILNYFPDVPGTEYYIWFSAGCGPVHIYYPELNFKYQLINININKQ